MCFFFVKVANNHFLVEKNLSCSRKNMFTIFLWRLNVAVTSQSDVPIFSLSKADWMDTKADPSLRFPHNHSTGFVLKCVHR